MDDVENYLNELERLSEEVQEEKKNAKLKKSNNVKNSNNDKGNQIGPQMPIKVNQVETQVIARAPVKSVRMENTPYYPLGPTLPYDIKKTNKGQIPDISEVPPPVGYTKNTIQSYAPVIPSSYISPIISMPTPIRKQTQTKEVKGKAASDVTIAHVRKKGEIEWEDHTLAEWDNNDFRIFVGDLGNEVTDETLKQAFLKYPSLLKVRVVHDKKNKKSKGFGFVSLADPNDYLKAIKEMDGVYVGNRPIKLRKSSWKDRLDRDKIKKLEKKNKKKSKSRVSDLLAN